MLNALDPKASTTMRGTGCIAQPRRAIQKVVQYARGWALGELATRKGSGLESDI
jgi:hypothetical protein